MGSKNSDKRNNHDSSKGYNAALQNFWSGRPITAIEHLTKILADDPNHPSLLKLYRLWIEILAEQKDEKGLTSLNNHITARSNVEQERLSSYMALSGLIHFELDELQAARLIAKTIKNERHDPYCQEFLARFYQREKGEDGSQGLWDLKNKIQDYYHYETIARQALVSKNSKRLNWVLEVLPDYYPNSPLVLNYTFQNRIEEKDFDTAREIAEVLTERFPNQTDYWVYAAYAAVKQDSFMKAANYLERALSIAGEKDADIIYLLSICYVALSKETNNEDFYNSANHFLQVGSELFKEQNLPLTLIEYQRSLLKNEDEKMNQQPRVWMIKLFAKNFHEIRTAPFKAISTLKRPMGSEPKTGDLCFFVADDYRASAVEKSWRIAAVYTVEGDPVWHPIYRYETLLKLYSRPESCIPIDIFFLDSDKNISGKDRLDSGHPFRYGVYELDQSGLDLITESIIRYREGEKESSKILSVIENLRCG